MYQRNFIPLFVTLSIVILLVIVVGMIRENSESEFTIASQPQTQTPIIPNKSTQPISTDPMVTPGPGSRPGY